MSNSSDQSRSFNPLTFIIVLLTVMSFFLGALWTKVEYLERTDSQVPVAPDIVKDSDPPSADIPTTARPTAQRATKKPQISADDHVRGNREAKITLVEYSDLECPFCKRFHPTMQQIVKEYGDSVRWVYRHFPLSFHANAQKEAEATECAAKLGGNDAFWKYVDAILDRTTSNGTGFALDKLVPLAGELNMNETKFKTCLDSGEFAQKVKNQITSGTEEGVTGTPGTIIIGANGETQLVPGALPYEQIKPMIDKALETI